MLKRLFALDINYDTRVYGLDVLRAIAILFVVIVHGAGIINNTTLENFPWIRMIDGVELFFVLSGFLIGSILLKLVNDNPQLKPTDLLNFWKRRWFRTLPNYYLILLVNWIIVKYKIIDGNIEAFNWKFIFFLHNFAEPFHSFFWESWSLSIEEWFYIFLPLILSVLLLFSKPKRAFLIAIVLLILAPLAYRISISSIDVDGFWWDTRFRKMVVTRLDTIIYGVLASWIKFYYPQFWKKCKYYALAIGVCMIYYLTHSSKDVNSFYLKTFYFNLTSIAAMMLLPIADATHSFKTRIGMAVTHISMISYSMYLVNLALAAQVIGHNFPVQSEMDAYLKYCIYWTFVIGFSTLLYKYFEKPMMQLRDKF